MHRHVCAACPKGTSRTSGGCSRLARVLIERNRCLKKSPTSRISLGRKSQRTASTVSAVGRGAVTVSRYRKLVFALLPFWAMAAASYASPASLPVGKEPSHLHGKARVMQASLRQCIWMVGALQCVSIPSMNREQPHRMVVGRAQCTQVATCKVYVMYHSRDSHDRRGYGVRAVHLQFPPALVSIANLCCIHAPFPLAHPYVASLVAAVHCILPPSYCNSACSAAPS